MSTKTEIVVKGQDAWTCVTENRSFRFKEVLGDSGNYEAVMLLEQTYHNERTPGLEGTQGKVTVNPWTLKQGKDRRRQLLPAVNRCPRDSGSPRQGNCLRSRELF